MEWYRRQKIAAARPPAYLVERVSDLRHAADVAATSPGNARTLVRQVISQLNSQNDSDFAEPLREACRIMLDSPSRAREIIEITISSMLAEKEELDIERLPRWKR